MEAQLADPGLKTLDANGVQGGHAHSHQHKIRHRNHTHVHTKEDLEDIQVIFFSLIVLMIFFQVVLFVWKTRFHNSFQIVSLISLWVIPGLVSYFAHFWRFAFVWTAFSAATLWVLRLASQTPVAPTTPKFVYRYFYFAYRASMLIFSIGVFILCVAVFLDVLSLDLELPLLLVFYGLYFGVLGRDMAETCAERMATNVGYYNKKGEFADQVLDPDTCALCALKFGDKQIETTFKLLCGHEFHNHCLRGWTMLGRKNMCPYCNARVDLRAENTNFWLRHSANWGQVLDAMRYLIVWNPLIALCAQGLVMIINRHHTHSHLH